MFLRRNPSLLLLRAGLVAATPLSPPPAKALKADSINRFDVIQVDARTQFEPLYESDRHADSGVSLAAVEASSDNPFDHISAVFRSRQRTGA
jgi:hypothetical protein